MEPGLWGEARCRRRLEALAWTPHKLPGPAPLPPMLESRPPHSWMAWQASGMPGMDPAVGLAQSTPPQTPATSPAAAGFREIKMARQMAVGRGSCFLRLPPLLLGQAATPELSPGSSPP